LVIILLCGVLGGCSATEAGPVKDEPVATTTEPAKCGNDWWEVELYRGEVAEWPEQAVDRLAPRSLARWMVNGELNTPASGALIGPDLFITACHVGMEVGYTVAFNYQVDETGVLDPEDRVDEYEVVEVIADRCSCACSNPLPNAADFNLYRLEGKPGLIYGWNTLSLRPWSNGDPMAVIGHPGGSPKKFSPGHMVSSSLLRFDAPTTGGSSGSPVLNEYGFQIGINTNEHTQGSCYNFGVPTSKILDLNAELPERARAALSTVVPVWMAVL
jgi:hypothetical protein